VTLADVRPAEDTNHVFLGFESELYVQGSPRAVLLVLRNNATVVVQLVAPRSLIGVAGYAARREVLAINVQDRPMVALACAIGLSAPIP